MAKTKSKTSKKWQAPPFEQMLMVAAILVSGPRWVGAFLMIENIELAGTAAKIFSIALVISGVGMGIVEVAGSAFLFQAIPRVKGKRRLQIVWAAFWGSIAVMLLVQVPYLMAVQDGVTVSEMLAQTNAILAAIVKGIWSFSTVLATILIVGGVAATQDSLVPKRETVKTASPVAVERPKEEPEPESEPSYIGMLKEYLNNPQQSQTKLAEILSISRPRIGQLIKVAEKKGDAQVERDERNRIVSVNVNSSAIPA